MGTTEKALNDAIRAVMGLRRESQVQLAAAIGMQAPRLNSRLMGKTAWKLDDLDALAAHWGCQPWDLMQGPAFALSRLPNPINV